MTENNKSGLSKLLNLVVLMPSLLNVFSNLTRIVEADAKLAGKTLFRFVLLCVLGIAFLLASWFCLLTILYLYLISLHLSGILSLSILFIVNILLLIIVGLLLANMKNNLFFPHLCRLFRG